MTERNIETRFGPIWLDERNIDEKGNGSSIVFLHGNSASSLTFSSLVQQANLDHKHILLPDFPGHGKSRPANDPETVYGLQPFAELIADLMEQIDAESYVLFGWSMGGHVALELMDHPKVAGAMICGTPPVSMSIEDIVAGFKQNDLGDLTYKSNFTEEEAYAYALAGVGTEGLLTSEMVAETLACDGCFRGYLGKSLQEGRRSDHRKIAETNPKPLCVLNGADDALIDAGFMSSIAYANPWKDTPYLFKDAGHAPFLNKPEMFANLIAEFAGEVVLS